MSNEFNSEKSRFPNPNYTLNSRPDNSTPAIQYVINAADTIKNNLDELKKTSYVDNLTGLLNQNALEKAKEKFDARRANPTLVFAFDLNYLKYTNDTYGHSEGDKLLQKMATLLQHTFRGVDDIYRSSQGDEFVVICKYDKSEKNVTEKILKRLDDNSQEINSTDKNDHTPLSFAVGAVEFDPHKHPDLESVLKEADQEMYRKKQEMKEKSAVNFR